MCGLGLGACVQSGAAHVQVAVGAYAWALAWGLCAVELGAHVQAWLGVYVQA